MITLDKEFGTFYDIFMKARNIATELDTEVCFPFNGVDFIVWEKSVLPRPFVVSDYVKNEQGGSVCL